MMVEERYLKITSCKECPHHGYTFNSKFREDVTIFICGYSKNMQIEQLPAEAIGGTLYPITHEGKFSKGVPIPFWCKLDNIAYYQDKIIEDGVPEEILFKTKEGKKYD